MHPTSANAQNNFGYELISQPGVTNFSGGDATELSGITYSGTTNSLFAVSDSTGSERAIYEFSLAGQHQRKISVNIGGLDDMEGISWMYDNRFVIASEDRGDLYVVEIGSDQNSVNSYIYVVDLSITENGGFGLEGVAYDQSSPTSSERFYVVDEQNASGLGEVRHVSYATNSGAVTTLSTFTIPSSEALDLGGIYHSGPTQKLYLLSEMSDKLFEASLDSEGEIQEILSSLTLTGFRQPEGLTFKPDMSEMIVVGEDRQFARFARTSPSQPITIRTQDATVEEGDSITVPIEILLNQSNESIVAVDMALNYDQDVLDVQSCTVEGGFGGICIEEEAGEVKIGVFNANAGGMSNDFTLANIEFTAVGAAGDSTVLSADVDTLAGSNSIPLTNIEIVNGQISIVNPPYLLGDVDCNGVVEIVDALLIAQYAVRLRTDSGGCPLSDPQLQLHVAAGDLSGDGSLNILDAYLVARCAVGIDCPGDELDAATTNLAATAREITGPVTVDMIVTGNTVSLNVSDSITAGTFEVASDKNAASFSGCRGIGATGALTACREVRPGLVQVSYINPQGASSDGPLVELIFDMLPEDVEHKLDLSAINLLDSNGNPLSVSGAEPRSFNIHLPLINQ